MNLQRLNWRQYFYLPVRLDYTSTGEKVPYDPLGIDTGKIHQPQIDFHDAETRNKAMFGGSGLGKSMSAAREAELFLASGNPYTCWIVSPTYELAEKEFRYIWEDMMISQGLQNQCKYRYNVRSGDLYIKLPTGAEIHGKSEKDPNSLLGEAIHILILGEGAKLKKETYDRYLRRAVARAEGIVICNTTPAGYNWNYDTFYLPYLHGNPRFWSGIYDVLQNPYYSKEEYENARKDLEHSPEIFQEQFQGKFVQYSGLIYPEFNWEWHLYPIEIESLPKQFPLVCLIDPHPARPTAVLWSLTDRENCKIYGDELWLYGLVPDVCEIIYERSKVHKRTPLWFVVDTPDKEDVRTGLNLFREYRKELCKRFNQEIICKTVAPSARAQELAWIFKVKAKFKTNCEHGAVVRHQPKLKKPWITIANHCKQFRYELEHSCWGPDRKPTKDNHFLDLVRYDHAENVEFDTKARTTIFNYKTRKYRGESRIYA